MEVKRLKLYFDQESHLKDLMIEVAELRSILENVAKALAPLNKSILPPLPKREPTFEDIYE